MPNNGKGRPRSASDQEARRVGQDDSNGTFINDGRVITPTTTSEYTIPAGMDTTAAILVELEESWPLIPLRVLLCTDARPREIVRRLRLNVAIRMLLDAIRESEVASW
jgi:hypothetical protein